MNALQYQILQMLQGLQTPEGILGIAVLLMMAIMTVGVTWMRWVVLAVLLYVCTFGVSYWTGLNLAFPLQQIRTFGRGICGMMLILLMIPTIRSSRGWRRHILSGGM